MKLILSAIEPPLADAWEKFCGDLDFVEIQRGSIIDVDCDAVVSPANSFGFMDGGIDALYLDYFGPEIQMIVRRQIYEYHHGELIVGNADVVETDNDKIPFLIVAPTMRVPMVLNESVNPYLAARAVFRLIKDGVFLAGQFEGKRIGDHINRFAIPGLGTGVGKVGYNTCAHQVRAAIDDVLLEKYRMPRSWAEASERHQLLYTTKLKRLQY
ncbi:MAG TPA: macro domain-containing protein [Pyrinomonadaceae bacterium]|nr:macro domain-containing protein [Pyrinomonadaceae bacterium]